MREHTTVIAQVEDTGCLERFLYLWEGKLYA